MLKMIKERNSISGECTEGIMSKQRIPKSQYVLIAKIIGEKYQLRVDLLNGSAVVPVSLQTGKDIAKFLEHLQRGNIYHKAVGVMIPTISTTQGGRV